MKKNVASQYAYGAELTLLGDVAFWHLPYVRGYLHDYKRGCCRYNSKS